MTVPRVDEIDQNAARFARMVTEDHALFVLDEINALPKKAALYLMGMVCSLLPSEHLSKFLTTAHYAAFKAPRGRMVYSKRGTGKRVKKNGKVPSVI